MMQQFNELIEFHNESINSNLAGLLRCIFSSFWRFELFESELSNHFRCCCCIHFNYWCMDNYPRSVCWTQKNGWQLWRKKKNRSQLTHRIHCDLIWFGSSLEMGKCSIMSDQFVFFYLLVSTYISILVLVLWSVRFNCWFTYSVFWFKEMHCTKLFAPTNFFIRCLTHSAARVHIPSFHIDSTHLLLF